MKNVYYGVLVAVAALFGVGIQAVTGDDGSISATMRASVHVEKDPAVEAVHKGAVGRTWLVTVEWESDLDPDRWYILPDARQGWRAVASTRGFRGFSGIEEGIETDMGVRFDRNAVQVDGGSSGAVTIAYNATVKRPQHFRPVQVWVAAESDGQILDLVKARLVS